MLDRTKNGCAAALALGFGFVTATPAQAHFILLKPDNWVDQDQSELFGGAPQKAGPCGPGGGDDVQPIPTNDKVTEVHVGETVHVTWKITVPHDGYFRLALAEDRGDFVDPTFTDATACTYDDSSVKKGAHDNVLMDGIDAEALGQDFVVPDMPCEKCTLQVIQVMKNHGPPNCIYYHCADLKILPGSGGGSDGGVPTGTGGASAGTGGASAGTGGVAAGSGGSTGSGGKGAAGVSGGSGGKGATASGGSSASTGSGGAMVSAPSGSGGGTVVTSDGSEMKDDGGCAVARPGAAHCAPTLWALFGLGLAGWVVRRRRK